MLTIRELFAKSGLRCTKQREQVYAALAATKSHPTAEALFSTVREVEPGLSLATVYNTLEIFTQRGLCRRLAGPPGAVACRYDADVSQHAHLSLPNGHMVDLPKDLSDRFFHSATDDLISEVERRMGIKVGRIAVQVICDSGYSAPDDGQDSNLS